MRGEVISCEDRLRGMLACDKGSNPERMERVIKSEMLYVMRNYFEVAYEDMEVSIGVREDGKYEVNMTLVSPIIKLARCF